MTNSFSQHLPEIDLEAITLKVTEIVRKTGIFLRNEQHRLGEDAVETKGVNNFVTYVDRTSEEMLVESLQKLLPDSGFIAEENDLWKKPGELTWIVDPLDGTTNYIHHIPLYAISVGLLYGEEVISGVVYETGRDECFYSWKGAPAFLNGRIIKVSNAASLNDSLLATGFPYSDFGRLEPYLGVFRELMHQTHGIRRLGSAAVDLAYVACGRFEGFYEYGLHSWDVAAGSLIVKQAGGMVTDFSGKERYLFGKEILATNRRIHPEFLQLIGKYFGSK